ncbi:iron-siderophore ABC transporter substrate-binding protein [Neorhizobium sp. NCHU2750]|uniref:iron-siderophore ABC transporter substrate-binding protein n=1 Tax=Neorhizobium sp. NCHU2750 TaxID=1825976 RepID=UPI000E73EDC6|nr:iron ABC transporter substrate-binding protein [Neorhizobium sp. NCHU2750]
MQSAEIEIQRDGPAGINRRAVCFGIAGVLVNGFAPALAGASAEGFPRTVRHALGTTVVTARPRRLATLGWNSEDIVLALGLIPAAMERRGLFDSGIFPWNEPLLGAEMPVLLQSEMLDFEQIAVLQPDLIIVLAAYSNFSAIAYERLSRIAPTVVHQSMVGRAPWRVQTAFVGKVLGRTDAADASVAATERFLAELKSRYPSASGKTFMFATYSAGDGNLGLYLATDPRMQILQQLGLKIAPAVERLTAANPGKWRTSISLERVDELEADIFVFGYGSEIQQSVEASNLLQQVTAIRTGKCVYLDDPELVWASSALSVLSIPYAFGSFFQRIADIFESERG